ncbi:MAG: hypothetical protein V4628_12250 [Pseudomonadota bacterium]
MKKYVKIECVIETEDGEEDEITAARMQALLRLDFDASSLNIIVLPATQLVQAQD